MHSKYRRTSCITLALAATVFCTARAQTAAQPHEAVAPANPVSAPSAAPATAVTGAASTVSRTVFPPQISPKYAGLKPSGARMKSCLDQYRANKATNGNGGMAWIQKGGGYFSVCAKKLKSSAVHAA